MFETIEQIKQYCFTAAVQGLRNQGWERCTREEPFNPNTDNKINSIEGKGLLIRKCAWSNEKPGVHCAVGHLLDPVKVSLSQTRTQDQCVIEAHRRNLFTPIIEEWCVSKGEDEVDKLDDFLYHLQVAHDSRPSGEAHDMEQRFRLLATANGLDWPEEASNG